nr:isoform 2 of gdsl esterase/lipase [Quercus suber]
MEAAIKDTIVKFVISCASSVVSAGLSRDVNGRQHHETEEHEPFNVPLSSWIPYLFVNPHDPICSEYIAYFEQRKKMRAKRLGGVDRFLTKSCMDSGSEPLHLIPSADLTINRCQLTKFQGPFSIAPRAIAYPTGQIIKNESEPAMSPDLLSKAVAENKLYPVPTEINASAEKHTKRTSRTEA